MMEEIIGQLSWEMRGANAEIDMLRHRLDLIAGDYAGRCECGHGYGWHYEGAGRAGFCAQQDCECRQYLDDDPI